MSKHAHRRRDWLVFTLAVLLLAAVGVGVALKGNSALHSLLKTGDYAKLQPLETTQTRGPVVCPRVPGDAQYNLQYVRNRSGRVNITVNGQAPKGKYLWIRSFYPNPKFVEGSAFYQWLVTPYGSFTHKGTGAWAVYTDEADCWIKEITPKVSDGPAVTIHGKDVPTWAVNFPLPMGTRLVSVTIRVNEIDPDSTP